MRILQTHDMPTHALVILDASRKDHEPLVVPIDLAAFSATFQNADNLQTPSRSPLPPTKYRYGVPYTDPAKGGWIVTLPTLVVEAPHSHSLPLLLLYALWDYLPNQPAVDLTPPPSPESFKSSETSPPPVPRTPPPTPLTTASFESQSSIASIPILLPLEPERPVMCLAQLATHLLPMPVLEEFPAFPAQAEVMARLYTDDELRAMRAFNGGLWKNVLLLAPRDHTIQEIASNAWNTAAAAYKNRAEYRVDRARMERLKEKAEARQFAERAASRGRQEGAVASASNDVRQAEQPAEASSMTLAASDGREASRSRPTSEPQRR